MDRFLAIEADVREALSGVDLELYPEDYSGNIVTEKRFARYSTLFSSSTAYNHHREPFTSGMLMVRLFSERGQAGKYCFTDAAKLNLALEDKIFTNKTRFGKGTLSTPSPDPANESLVLGVYSIPLTLHNKEIV